MNPRVLLRPAFSVALLSGLVWALDGGRILRLLAGIRPGWIVGALAVSVVQVGISAWRWRFTARRLDLDLSFGRAFREYYLATFLNQVLPGGVVGDVSRAWRQARIQDEGAPPDAAWRAARAVALERISGQVVMLGVAGGCAFFLAASDDRIGWGVAFLFGAVAFGAVAAAILVRGLRRWARPYWDEIRDALLSRRAFPTQILLSVLIVGSYVAVFWIAALAVGMSTPAGLLLPLIPLVLVAMLVPVSFAGWGVREGAAAALWAGVGLAPADGVAVSVTYGLLVLVSSLPGAVIGLGSAVRSSSGALKSRSKRRSRPREK